MTWILMGWLRGCGGCWGGWLWWERGWILDAPLHRLIQGRKLIAYFRFVVIIENWDCSGYLEVLRDKLLWQSGSKALLVTW